LNNFFTSRWALLLLACSVFTPGARAGDAADTQIRIGGSGGPLATMHLLAEAFQKTHPQARFVIVPSLSSGGGIKALRAGALDLALVSRPLTDKERSPDLVATEYARTPFVFATAPRTGARGITTAELVSIYNGQRTSWPDGRPLRLVLRPKTDSDTDITKSLSPEMNQAVNASFAREGLLIATTDQASADSIETIPGAIGTTTLAQIISEKRKFQMLALNGVVPGLDTLAEGKYPHYKTFFVVTGPASSPTAREFAVFLQSTAGRELLQKNGHGFGPSR
jgi:phosphate transport system substrate-binding protein